MVSEPNWLNRILAVMAAIADISAVSALLAQFIRQDNLLVLVIVIIAVGVVLILNRLFQRGIIDRQGVVILGVLCLASIVIAVVFWASLASVKVTPIQLTIVEPKDGADIDNYRHVITGTVSDPNARVDVVMRPFETLDYWVQERPTVDANGKWQVNAYFGEKNIGIGDDYEIIALTTNENFLVTLMTGNCLRVGKRKNIPTNTNRSNFVTVTRTR